MIAQDKNLRLSDLRDKLKAFWALSGEKILLIERQYDEQKGAPVFTRQGRYTSRGWTEWTQGFQYGAALVQFDATDDARFLDLGRTKTMQRMAPHLTHTGVHDHGFNNVSTYGHLLRLAREGRFEPAAWEQSCYELAMKVTGAVQAGRWSAIKEGGYIYSFNGPHSLFADTIRSLRALAVSHQLGHVLMGENDERISLLGRLILHARTTARYIVFYGEGRDAYDVRGRVAHEAIFNLNDGCFRCPNSQQGYSPFSTWTRGLAWILLGYAEQLEFLSQCPASALKPWGGVEGVSREFLKAACSAADFYIANTPRDGIPYWDTGAPGLAQLDRYLERAADPFNAHEPVDSSAAAIAAQGLLRLGHYLGAREGKRGEGNASRYWRAGLTVMSRLMEDPYMSRDRRHQGLLLHSVYHRPNGWDFIPKGQRVPCGESCMWGDYHVREAALYLQRLLDGKAYLTFF